MRICGVEFFTGGILAMCKVSDLGIVQSFQFLDWESSISLHTEQFLCGYLNNHSCTIPRMSHLSLE